MNRHANFSSRRRKIITMGLGLLALTPFSSFLLAEQKRPELKQYSWLDIFAGEVESAKIIGETYLKHEPSERNHTMLLRLINDELEIVDQQISQGHGMTMDTIREKFSEDFESGKTVCIRGWVLSRTEARLCALYAIA